MPDDLAGLVDEIKDALSLVSRRIHEDLPKPALPPAKVVQPTLISKIIRRLRGDHIDK